MPTADSVAPRIYASRRRLNRVSIYNRWIAFGLALGCLSLLTIAAGLTPNRDGNATHTQLGIQPCGFLIHTGLPCPACGMTTSFAWFSRGNLAASFYIQPMGMVLAVIAGLCVWGGGYVAVTGRPIYRVFSIIPEKMYLYPLLTMGIIGWGWKMFIHVHGIDGWK